MKLMKKGCFQPMILFDNTFLLDWHINLAVLCHFSAMLNVARFSYTLSLSLSLPFRLSYALDTTTLQAHTHTRAINDRNLSLCNRPLPASDIDSLSLSLSLSFVLISANLCILHSNNLTAKILRIQIQVFFFTFQASDFSGTESASSN